MNNNFDQLNDVDIHTGLFTKVLRTKKPISSRTGFLYHPVRIGSQNPYLLMQECTDTELIK